MLLENDHDHDRTQVSVLVESVRALVNAIAAGTIEVDLAKDVRKTLLRYAPSFRLILPGSPSESSRNGTSHPKGGTSLHCEFNR